MLIVSPYVISRKKNLDYIKFQIQYLISFWKMKNKGDHVCKLHTENWHSPNKNMLAQSTKVDIKL
jgi:hypothetical protein